MAPNEQNEHDEQVEPGTLGRLRARYRWLDHLIRAFLHFRECNGNLFAAGLTYYTLIALFPLLMIAFAVGGSALSRRPQLVDAIDERTRTWVSPELGQQLVTLMNSAISAHTSVGVIGLVFAAWMGQTWMYRLREALCRIWGHRADSLGFARTIASDLAAVLSTFYPSWCRGWCSAGSSFVCHASRSVWPPRCGPV